jgi:hypothetical protein
MKRFIMKISLIAAIGLISFSAQAQNRTHNVPQAVVTAFSATYPKAKLRHWRINKDTCIASFKWADRKYEAYYSKNGDWIRSEREIRHKTSLPEGAQLFLKSGRYASWHIDDLQNVSTPSHSLFLVSVDNNSGNPVSYSDNGSVENKMLYFDDRGKLIKVIDL